MPNKRLILQTSVLICERLRVLLEVLDLCQCQASIDCTAVITNKQRKTKILYDRILKTYYFVQRPLMASWSASRCGVCCQGRWQFEGFLFTRAQPTFCAVSGKRHTALYRSRLTWLFAQQWRTTLTGGPWTNYIKCPIPYFAISGKNYYY